MGKIVYQQLLGLSVTADATQDVWSLMAGASSPLLLWGFELTSDAVASLIIECDLHRITAAGSGGAASTTESLRDTRQSAPTGNMRTLDTTPGAATAGGGLHAWEWEQLGPVGIVYVPEMRPRIEVNTGVAFGWLTPSASVVSGWVCWEEL